MSAKHKAIFAQYSNTFPSDVVAKWQEIVDNWDKDQSSKPDPYEETFTCKCFLSFLKSLLIYFSNDLKTDSAQTISRRCFKC